MSTRDFDPRSSLEYVRVDAGLVGYPGKRTAYLLHADDLSRVLSGCEAPARRLYRERGDKTRMMHHGSRAECEALEYLRGRTHEPGLHVKYWLRNDATPLADAPSDSSASVTPDRAIGVISGPLPVQTKRGVWALRPGAYVFVGHAFGSERVTVYASGRTVSS